MFIAFEGIDGCGKSTNANLLQHVLEERGYDVVLTRQPGGSPLGEKMRNMILAGDFKDNLMAEVLAFAIGRLDTIKNVIAPALKQNKIVITDRWFGSRAYQLATFMRGDDLQHAAAFLPADADEFHFNMVQINRLILHDPIAIKPDLVYFLDLPLEVARKRTADRSDKPDRFESEPDEYFQWIYEQYKIIAQREDYVTIAANQATENVINDILTVFHAFAFGHGKKSMPFNSAS